MSKAYIKEIEELIFEFRHMQNTLNENEKDTYVELIGETQIQTLETILKELKRLQEDYISKDKIREKIEECIKNIEEDEKDEWGYETYVVQVLNKLLNAN